MELYALAIVGLVLFVAGIFLYRAGSKATTGELNEDVIDSVSKAKRYQDDWAAYRRNGGLGADDKRLQPHILEDGILSDSATDRPDENAG